MVQGLVLRLSSLTEFPHHAFDGIPENVFDRVAAINVRILDKLRSIRIWALSYARLGLKLMPEFIATCTLRSLFISFPRTITIGGLVLLATMVGCGHSTSTAKTYPVKGKITYKGKALEHGTVVFVSQQPDVPASTGELNPDGTFSLSTYAPNDGAPAGEYKVVVEAFEATGPANDMARGTPKALVPKEYLNLNSTPLRETVKDQPMNEFEIQL